MIPENQNHQKAESVDPTVQAEVAGADASHPEETGTETSGGNMPKAGSPGTYVTGRHPKESRRIPLASAIGTVVTAVILAVLITFSLTTMYHTSDGVGEITSGQGEEPAFSELITLDKLFRSLTVRDLDDEAIGEALLKAYVEATGDHYARYYNEEEYKALIAEQNGSMCGIGISVFSNTLEYDGVTYQVVQVDSVYPDSPAEAAGVLAGDAIMRIGDGEDAVAVNDIGYTEALARLKGEEGTVAVFSVWRRSEDGNGYDTIRIEAERKQLTTLSVTGRVCTENEKVGVIRIRSFDNTTMPQFRDAMDQLIAGGCDAFVIDLRNNPGGLLSSVEDVLTFFLSEGDVMLYTRDRDDKKETACVTVSDGKVTSGSGQLKPEDVGCYRQYPITVLVNGYSASAAELFTANVRDHKLGTVIGTNTYGKGTMQTTYPLSRYGYAGALKLTTRYYDPPCGENYDGIGILPDFVVELSEEAQSYNSHMIPDRVDNQLMTAVSVLKP